MIRILLALGSVSVTVLAGSSKSYFATYAHPDIHRQMLQDRVRTEAYQEALSKTPEVVRGKVVLDFGCGTGILSIFAAKAGASRVYCIEASEMAAITEKNVKANGLSDVIRVLRTTHTKLHLDQKVDVIVSEWMGFLMVLEDMLDDLLYVRDRWLKPGGVVWPRFAQMWMQPYSASDWWAENIEYWDSKPYGVDLSPMAEYAFGHEEFPWPIRSDWRADGLLGSPHLISDWDLQELHLPRTFKQSTKFLFPIKEGTVHGMIYWFDCVFDLPSENVTMSTHPAAGVQHWGQIFWPLKGAPLVAPEDGSGFEIEGALQMLRAPPAWGMNIKWRALPFVKKIVESSTGKLHVEHLSKADDWSSTRAMEFWHKGSASSGGNSWFGKKVGKSEL